MRNGATTDPRPSIGDGVRAGIRLSHNGARRVYGEWVHVSMQGHSGDGGFALGLGSIMPLDLLDAWMGRRGVMQVALFRSALSSVSQESESGALGTDIKSALVKDLCREGAGNSLHSDVSAILLLKSTANIHDILRSVVEKVPPDELEKKLDRNVNETDEERFYDQGNYTRIKKLSF